jgi:hypothetical protein
MAKQPSLWDQIQASEKKTQAAIDKSNKQIAANYQSFCKQLKKSDAAAAKGAEEFGEDLKTHPLAIVEEVAGAASVVVGGITGNVALVAGGAGLILKGTIDLVNGMQQIQAQDKAADAQKAAAAKQAAAQADYQKQLAAYNAKYPPKGSTPVNANPVAAPGQPGAGKPLPAGTPVTSNLTKPPESAAKKAFKRFETWSDNVIAWVEKRV